MSGYKLGDGYGQEHECLIQEDIDSVLYVDIEAAMGEQFGIYFDGDVRDIFEYEFENYDAINHVAYFRVELESSKADELLKGDLNLFMPIDLNFRSYLVKIPLHIQEGL